MGCGCGGKPSPTVLDDYSTGQVQTGFTSVFNDATGVYDLASHPECSTPYSGAFTGVTVYVVGRGTEAEQVFTRGEMNEARRYARQESARLEHFPARALCHDAMLEKLGA